MEYSAQFNNLVKLATIYYANPLDPRVHDFKAALLKSFYLKCQNLITEMEICQEASPYSFPLQILPDVKPEDLPGFLSTYFTGEVDQMLRLAPRVKAFPKSVMTLDVYSFVDKTTFEPVAVDECNGEFYMLEVSQTTGKQFKSYLLQPTVSMVEYACKYLGAYFKFNEGARCVVPPERYDIFPKMLSHKQGLDVFSLYRCEPDLLTTRITEPGHYVQMFIHNRFSFIGATRTAAPKVFKHCLELPGGKADIGLTLNQSMKKELKEETKLKYDPLMVQYAFSYFHYDHRGNTSNVHFYTMKYGNKLPRCEPLNENEAKKNDGFQPVLFNQLQHYPRKCPAVAIILDIWHGQLGRHPFHTSDLSLDRPGFEDYSKDLIDLTLDD